MSSQHHAPSSTGQRLLVGLIGAYRRAVSPLLPGACRFHPSCSAYAAEAISTHGSARGLMLAAARLLRCHPLCEGGIDPVPAEPAQPAHAPIAREKSAAMKGCA
jgi:putative membrane protein insertion efficiency factor